MDSGGKRRNGRQYSPRRLSKLNIILSQTAVTSAELEQGSYMDQDDVLS